VARVGCATLRVISDARGNRHAIRDHCPNYPPDCHFCLSLGGSSKQARREHERQEAIRQFDEEQKREVAEEKAKQLAWRREHPVEETQRPAAAGIDEETEITNLKSSDREALNSAIQRLSIHHVCRAVPGLIEILKSTRDDYIAGIAAQAVVGCKQPVAYPTFVDEFLNRQATPALIFAVGETGSQDDRVYAKLHKLITEPNADTLVSKFAVHAKQQIDIQTQLGAQGH
jgi:hypothetical protein